MTSLPPMRRGILNEVLKIVFLFGTLGFLLIILIHFSSKNPKSIFFLNYHSSNSIIAMFDNWDSLYIHEINNHIKQNERKIVFQQSLNFLEKYSDGNDESILLNKIRIIFEKYKNDDRNISSSDYFKMKELLRETLRKNQNKVSKLIMDRENFSTGMVFLACVIFFIALAISVYFSERLSSKISQPIKKIAEILQSKPDLNHKLKFPEPVTLEIKVLMIELSELWKRLSDLHYKNLKNLKTQRNELNTVFDSMEDAIVVLDHIGKVEHYNKLFLHFIGAKDQSLLYQPWSDISISSQSYLQLRNLVRKEHFEESRFWALVDGAESIYRVRKRVIYDEDKNRSGIILILHDLSSRFSPEQFKESAIRLKSEQLRTNI